MATMNPEQPDPFDEFLEPEEELQPPELSEIFLTDFNGNECVTLEGLDWIWPVDDREPLEVGGKGFIMPPTCEEQIPCYEKYGDEVCMKFVFDGPDLPGINANVPLPGALPLAVTAIAALLFMKGKKS